jgi:hypothetical protein
MFGNVLVVFEGVLKCLGCVLNVLDVIQNIPNIKLEYLTELYNQQLPELKKVNIKVHILR